MKHSQTLLIFQPILLKEEKASKFIQNLKNFENNFDTLIKNEFHMLLFSEDEKRNKEFIKLRI
jgi:hypothetical protein